MWIIYAVLGAIFASLTSITAKIGVENVNSNLATAIRTIVVLVLAWGMVFLTGAQTGVKDISAKSMIFLVISGTSTGLSWLFFYRALQMGNVSKVVPIDKLSIVLTLVLSFFVLQEKMGVKDVVGGALIAVGTLVMVL